MHRATESLTFNLSSVNSVHKCRNLPPMDANGLADPFVKVMLNKDGLKQKSERKEKTLNPDFEETFF